MKININNSEKIQSELDKIQERCETRTITMDDIKDMVVYIEKRFKSLHVAKKYWRGAIFNINQHAHIFPASYKYSPQGTCYRLEYGSSNWFITLISRGHCNTGECNRVVFTNEQDYKCHYKF